MRGKALCSVLVAFTVTACSANDQVADVDASAPAAAPDATNEAAVATDSSLVDVPPPFPETGPPDTGICLPACAAAGGKCVSGSCTFECTGGTTCATDLSCPPGMPCIVNCTGKGACTKKLLCTGGSPCTFNCSGFGACAGKVQCDGPECTVSCDGPSSCPGDIACAASTGVCNVTCGGADSCGGPPITCQGTKCDVSCTGVSACKNGVCCTATTCNVSAGHSSC